MSAGPTNMDSGLHRRVVPEGPLEATAARAAESSVLRQGVNSQCFLFYRIWAKKADLQA